MSQQGKPTSYPLKSHAELIYCCPTAANPPSLVPKALIFLWYLQEKKRADERTRTADLLITSEKSEVAKHCSGLLWLAESPYLSGIFFTGLHAIASHCALGDVEVMYGLARRGLPRLYSYAGRADALVPQIAYGITRRRKKGRGC